MMGGFIKSDKSHTQSGVPFLDDIPILGNLFKQRSDSKDREELIVLMRPTVLKTPELAAKHTITEEQRLPGVSEAASEDDAYQRSLIDAQRKREQKAARHSGNYGGFFGSGDDLGTNGVSQPNTDLPAKPGAELDEAAPTTAPVTNTTPLAPALQAQPTDVNSTNAP
jgi:hypothetical protein